MRINTNQKGTQLFLEVYASDCETKVETKISSMVNCKVEQPTVNEIHNLVIDVSRYNGLSDLETAKNFVENTLNEKEIDELIYLLKK